MRKFGKSGNDPRIKDGNNLVPRVPRPLGQRVVTGRDSGVVELLLRLTGLSFVAVNNPGKANQKFNFFFITLESLPTITR